MYEHLVYDSLTTSFFFYSGRHCHVPVSYTHLDVYKRQMLYTTIFGVFTNFIFIRTGGNLWSCVLTHCFCNYMGFPQGSELVQELAMASSEASGYYTMIKKLWKWCYLALLIIGAIEFKNNIWNLTESTHTILT